jgi:hypothetical protein
MIAGLAFHAQQNIVQFKRLQASSWLKYCLMKGEEIKVESKILTWQEKQHAALQHHTAELQFFY